MQLAAGEQKTHVGGEEGLSSCVPRGTALNSNPTRLSLCTYNLLAPLYVRCSDNRTGKEQDFTSFGWVADEDIEWSYRQPMLRAELLACGADVLCLQEVQYERASSDLFDLPAWLQLPGYACILPSQKQLQHMAARNKRVLNVEEPVANALLYRTDRLVPVQSSSKKPNSTTRVSAAFVAAAGSELQLDEPVVVTCVHLDATSEAKRVSTLQKSLNEVRKIFNTRLCIVAGDMNTEVRAGSCVSAFLAKTPPPSDEELRVECASALRLCAAPEDDTESSIDGRSDSVPGDSEMLEWKALFTKARESAESLRIHLQRVPSMGTRCGWDAVAGGPECANWALDHVMYSSDRLQLVQHWQTIEADEESRRIGLPNARCPSDHLPVGCEFLVRPRPSLDAGRESELEEQRLAISDRQDSEMAAIQADFAKQEQELTSRLTSEGEKLSPEEEMKQEKQQKKKKKKKGKRPPPELIELLRTKRTHVNNARETWRRERVAFVDSLVDVERGIFMDAHEDWVEQLPR